MSASADLELMRASMLIETDPAAAARCAAGILAAWPGHEAASLLLAAACRRAGEPAGAISALESLVLAHPRGALPQLELGRTYAASGRGADAKAAFERAVDLDPSLADAWCLLSAALFEAGDITAADAAYLTYRRLAHDPVDLADAYLAFDQNRLEAAETLAQRRLKAGTNEVAAFTLLAAIAWRRGDDLSEEAALNEVLRLAPCDGTAREQLARLLIRQGRIEKALALIDRLLSVDPNRDSLWVLQAEALRLIDRHADALAVLETLVAGHPANPDFRLLVGNQQRYMGHTPEAIANYQRALELRPGYGAAYLALSNLKTWRFSPHDIDVMQRQIQNAALATPDAINLEFALGAAHEDAGRFADSFEHYARGNRRARDAFRYDANATTAFVRRFEATFTRQFFEERSGWGNPTIEPIFIVGLPRSGSTLVDQVLASHSDVEGTRELPYLPTIARELAGPPEMAARYPEPLTLLDKAHIESLAQRYLANAQVHRPSGRPRFIDKMHGNFASVGLIHLMFPAPSSSIPGDIPWAPASPATSNDSTPA